MGAKLPDTLSPEEAAQLPTGTENARPEQDMGQRRAVWPG